jgi:hypothetical protein
MDTYWPGLSVALLAVAILFLVRRGPLVMRTAVVLVTLLPLHTLLAAYVMRNRVCLLIDPDCLATLDRPVDILSVHLALAAVSCAVALLASLRRARRPARAPSRAAR